MRVLASEPGRVRSRLARARLEVDSFALTVSAGVTAVVGVAFWAIAARGYAPAEVGRGAAVVTTATMLATLSNLSLGGMYERFLRLAGTRALPLLSRGGLAGAGLSLLLSLGFLALGPTDRLFAHTWELALFPLLTVALSGFALLDGILVGLRRATWAAGKNVAHAIAKAALVLVAAVVTGSGFVLPLAWAGTAALLGGCCVVLVVRHVRAEPAFREPPSLPSTQELASYFGGTYGILVLSALPPLVIPLIVLTRLGAEVNAYFTVGWTVFSAGSLMLGTLIGPYLSAMAAPDGQEASLTRRFVLMLSGVALATGVALWVVAPLLLSIFGDDYSEQAVGLIRLMAWVMPLSVVGSVYGGLSRTVRRLRLAVGMQVFSTIALIAGCWWATGRYGLDGIGYTYLAVGAVTTAVLLVPSVRLIRSVTARGPGPAPAAPGPPGTGRTR